MIVGMADDVFPALRDHYRCPAVSRRDERRCQLQTRHNSPHAQVWQDKIRVSRRSRASPPPRLTRWTEDHESSESWPTAQRHIASGCAGRRSRCHDGGWGDSGSVGDIPRFVVTHHKPTRSHPPIYTFVTDGVVSAIEQAKHVAGDKVVGLHGATVMQQALPLGLVDEIRVHMIPVLLGGGTPLFGRLDAAITLERTSVQVTPTATHLGSRVVR